MRKKDVIDMFVTKEALSSVSLSHDPEIQTMVLGSCNNSKLYNIKVNVTNKRTNEIIWQGPIAQVCNYF